MVIRLRKLALVGLFLLGVGCLYLGFNGFGKQAQPEPAKPQREVLQVNGQGGSNSAVFVSFRQNRENNREEQIELLNELIANNNASKETREAAQKKMLELTQTIAKEGEIENLILAKGFRDAAVTIGSNTINVMIYAEKLTDDEITRIQDIVVRSTGIRLENIVIVPRQ